MSYEIDFNSPLYAVHRAMGTFDLSGFGNKMETVRDLIIVLTQDKNSLIASLQKDESYTYELFLLMAKALEKGLDQKSVGAKLILGGSKGHFDTVNNYQKIKYYLKAHRTYNYNLMVKKLKPRDAKLAVSELIHFSSNIDQYIKNSQLIYDEFKTWFVKQDVEMCCSADSDRPECALHDHLFPDCDFRACMESRFAEMKSGINDLDS